MNKKICCVITNRASYTKFKSLLKYLKKDSKINVQIVVASGVILEKYGNLDEVIKKDGFKITEKIHMLLESQTLLSNAKSTGIGVSEFSSCFERIKPDLVILMADRFEVLSAAIAASYQNIKIAHIQGGEDSGNIDQKVRYAVSHLSDFHFPSTKKSYNKLKNIFGANKNIFLSGCPSTDLCKKIEKKNLNQLIKISSLFSGVGEKIDFRKNYVLVMQHPVTDEYGHGYKQIDETMKACLKLNTTIIWFWPNPDSGSSYVSKFLRTKRETLKLKNILFIKNAPPENFLLLLKFSKCIIGNSSAGIRESSYLGVPSVNIGTRQSNRERAKNVLDCNYNSNNILKSIKYQLKKKYKKNNLYGHGNAGYKIFKKIKFILKKI